MKRINGINIIVPALFSFIIMLTLALAPLPTARAGTNEWTTNGPYGGTIDSLVISPDFATDHMLIAATKAGVFKSTDGGGSWIAASSGITGTTLSLAASPDFATDHTLFAGTSVGVFESSNGGQSWVAANHGLPDTDLYGPSGRYGLPIISLAVSPLFAMDQTVFVSTKHNGVFKSTNGGQSWSAVYASGGYLAISPNFVTDHTIFNGVAESVIKSTDGGSSWDDASNGLPTTSPCRPDEPFCHKPVVLAISPNFSADQTLFAGMGESIFESTSGGERWSEAGSGLTDPYGFQMASLAVSPSFSADQTLFASMGGILKSADGGQSWNAADNGFFDLNTGLLAVSPAFATDQTLFVGTSYGGVFKSTDGGQSWFPANSGIPDTSVSSMGVSPDFITDHILFAAIAGGVFKSTDSGRSWSVANSGLPVTNTIMDWGTALTISSNFASDHTLFVANYNYGGNSNSGGIFKSIDGGQSWNAAGSGISGDPGPVQALAVSPDFASDHTVFASTEFKGVFRSTDGGQSWNLVMGSPAYTNPIAISHGFATDQTLFVATAGGVSRSTDGGLSWSAAGSGLTGSIYSLAISPSFDTDHKLFAGTIGDGVFESSDAGQSWSAASSGLPTTSPVTNSGTSLIISPNFATDHTLFAGTYGEGVFESTDEGSSWNPANDSLGSKFVLSMAISPGFAADHTIFAGTSLAGAYSYTIEDNTAPIVSNVKPCGNISTVSTAITADFSDFGLGIDTASVVVYLDGSPLSGCTVSFRNVSCPVSELTQGNHSITGSVSDNAGNPSPISGTFSTAAHLNFWNWYDDTGGDNWIMLANPAAASSNLTYALFVDGASQDLSSANSGVVSPGRTLTPQYSGLTMGPVVSGLIEGVNGLVSQRTLWPKGGSSLEEVPGTKESDLSSDYWWTWYDQTQGRLDWVMVANPSASSNVYYQIDIGRSCEAQPKGATRCASGKLAPVGDTEEGDKAEKQFNGVIAGPVEVKGCDQVFSSDGACPGNPQNLIASQRVLSDGGQAFNELAGTPASKLSDDSLWTWYDSDTGSVVNGAIDGGYNWVMIANPSASSGVYYQISISDGCAVSDAAKCQSGKLAASACAALQFPNIMGGPVELKGCSQALASDGSCPGTPENLIASQRSLIGHSFEEVPGYPRSSLASSYNWTWYDEADTNISLDWVMISNPGSLPVSATISFKDQNGLPVNATQTIPPGANWNPDFPGKVGGPVNVTSTGGPVLASQRVLWKGYFNELLGTTLNIFAP